MKFKNEEVQQFSFSSTWEDLHSIPFSLAKWEKKLHTNICTQKSLKSKTNGRYRKRVDHTKQEFTHWKISARGLRQILPRGGGAFLATGTGTGTFSSGTGFLGGTGTLETLSTFRASVLSYWGPPQSTDTHPQALPSDNWQHHHLLRSIVTERWFSERQNDNTFWWWSFFLFQRNGPFFFGNFLLWYFWHLKNSISFKKSQTGKANEKHRTGRPVKRTCH